MSSGCSQAGALAPATGGKTTSRALPLLQIQLDDRDGHVRLAYGEPQRQSVGAEALEGCLMRHYATAYQVDPTRFAGERRRFSQDETHPDVVYEPGKCILCDICVSIAAEAGEKLGIATIGRGFKVAMGVPFDKPLSEGLRLAARRAAECCPTGALALRSARSCDLGACGTCPGTQIGGQEP